MFQAVLVEVIQAEREREIEMELRRRQLLRSRDRATDHGSTTHPDKGRQLAVRIRPTGG